MSVASCFGGTHLLNSSLLSNRYLHCCAVSRFWQLASFVLCWHAQLNHHMLA